MAPDEDAKRPLHLAAARTRTAVTGLSLLVAGLLLVERVGYAGGYRAIGEPSAFGAALGTQLVLAVPALLYLAALWQLRRAAAAVAAGSTFGPAVSGALKRVGALLMAGAALTLLAMPAVYGLLESHYPRLIEFDVTTLIVGTIGAALVFLGRLVDRAGEVQRELDEIF